MFDLIVISPENNVENENRHVTAFFEQDLKIYHLRKPGWDESMMDNYIRIIPPEFHNRLVIHSHFRLAEKYTLKGIHLNSTQRKFIIEKDCNQLNYRNTESTKSAVQKTFISTSYHTFEEIESAYFTWEYVFLSPVFDSISKRAYKSGFDLKLLAKQLTLRRSTKISDPGIIALGGLSASNIGIAKQIGFSGAAVLGAIWESENPLEKFLNLQKLVTTLRV